MAYQLRERHPYTMEKMKRNIVSVEVNLFAKREKLKFERRVTIKEEPSSSLDEKLDTLVKTMERVMGRMTMTNTALGREPQGGPQIRNPNLRRNQPQIKQIEPINPIDQ